MILLSKEITMGNSKYVLTYLDDGTELRQQGELYGYTDTTFAVVRNDHTYVYDTNNREIFKYPKENKYAKDDLEVFVEVNQ